MSISLQKVTAKSAQEITQRFQFVDEFQPVLDHDLSPAEFMRLLLNGEHYSDAVVFLAHALPMREAIWWACVCARYHLNATDQLYQQGLTIAEAWVYDPSDAHRRICKRYMEQGEKPSAASLVCSACFWTGGTISVADAPPMEVPPHLYMHAVAAAIITAVGFQMPDKKLRQQRYITYLKHGINIANGGNG